MTMMAPHNTRMDELHWQRNHKKKKKKKKRTDMNALVRLVPELNAMHLPTCDSCFLIKRLKKTI